MEPVSALLVFILLIALLLPPSPWRSVAKKLWAYWDPYLKKPARRVMPARCIRWRFGLPKRPINLFTYVALWAEFLLTLFLIGFCLCFFFMGTETASRLWFPLAVLGVLFLLACLPGSLYALRVYSKWTKEERQQHLYGARSPARMLSFSEKRTIGKEFREWVAAIHPFLKEAKRCVRMQKGVHYIPAEFMPYFEQKLFPKYAKALGYTLTETDAGQCQLTVYARRDKRPVWEMPVREKRG